MSPTMAQIVEISGVTRDTINKWMERGGVLQTSIPQTRNTAARRFSRENALEIAFTAALTRAGIAPKAAGDEARAWIDQERSGNFEPFFTFNPRRNLRAGVMHGGFLDLLDNDKVERLTDDVEHADADFAGEIVSEEALPNKTPIEVAATIITINRALLVRRIDRISQGD